MHDKLKHIRLLLLDVDGVMTDGGIIYDGSGLETKRFNVKDGHGIKMLQRHGVEVGIITGRTSRCLELRAKNLGIELLYQGVHDKARAFAELVAARSLTPVATAYMGDDVVDLPVLLRCGLALSVPDAPLLVKQHADYVTRARGGHGAAREICELIMHAQGTLAAQLDSYLR